METKATATARPTLASLQAENAALRAKLAEKNKAPKLTIKKSAKGGISVYGLGRFPDTKYKSQVVRLAREVYGLTDEQFAASPMGKFIAATPDLAEKSEN